MASRRRKRNEAEQQGAHALVLERRKKAMELRKMGAGYDQIAAALGITPEAAFRDVRVSVNDIQRESNDEMLKLELERLDVIMLSFWNRMRNGEQKAAEVILDVMRRRAQYLGLDPKPGAMVQIDAQRPRIVIQEAQAPAKLEEGQTSFAALLESNEEVEVG